MTTRSHLGARVLVIDDDPLFLRALARVLSEAGHAVRCVESVRQGVRAFGEASYDVVVTDVYMPDEDGLDALRQLRQARPDTSIIVLSGRLTGAFGTTLRDVVLHLGAAAALAKTSDAGSLVDLVERLASGPTLDFIAR